MDKKGIIKTRMWLNNKIKSFCESLVDVVYPLNCLICRAKLNASQYSPLCSDCFSSIKKINPPFCIKCGKPLEIALTPSNKCLNCRKQEYNFDRAWSSTKYDGVMRECIHKLKYNRKFSLGNMFSRILIEFVNKYMEINKFDFIIPVPLHRTKLREREFNQAQMLAEPLSSNFNKRLLSKNIYRIRYTLSQSELSLQERRENIRGAFGISNPELIKGKDILIIDDVFTTGATVNECASLLKRNGAGLIEVLTLAR